ncbi:hypothetical protein D3261_10320 [Halococcus sp. IIIV-5B]|nr:hypothetical protein D3261_10320 [Halococcus sp. IIIV-5B]
MPELTAHDLKEFRERPEQGSSPRLTGYFVRDATDIHEPQFEVHTDQPRWRALAVGASDSEHQPETSCEG